MFAKRSGVLLSIRTLIKENYLDDIKESLQSLFDNEATVIGKAHYPRMDISSIYLDSINIARIYINDYEPFEVEVSIQVKMEWLVTYGDSPVLHRCGPWANLYTFFNLADDSVQIENITYNLYKEEEYDYPLDEYLVPVISRPQWDEIAEELLNTYYPEVLEENKALDPLILCNRLGLEVIELPLCPKGKIRGQVYFRDAEVETMVDREYQNISVPRGTIVIDDSLFEVKGQGAYNFTIVHECVHWILHQKAAMFAKMVHSNMEAEFEKINNTTEDKIVTSHSYMETQANAIASSMMIPKRTCVEKVEKSQDEYEKISRILSTIGAISENPIAGRIEWAVREISQIYNVSISSAKIRLIDLGYEEAMGVLNYIDGGYLPQYSFAKGSIKRNQTFSLKQKDFYKLLESSPTFREEIASQNYLYIDSHVVKNNPRYVEKKQDGEIQLTAYARQHMDECCLIFEVHVLSKGISLYSFYNSGILYHRQDVKLKFEIAYPESKDRTSYIQETHNDLYDLLSNLPSHFPNAINMVMEYYGYTQDEMSELCDLSIEKLRELKNRDDVAHSLETILQFCCGMKLPPHVSDTLLSMSGHRLTNNRKDLFYKTMLWTVAVEGLEACNEYLISQQLKPLGKTARSSNS